MHSALAVGLDNAKMIGFSLQSDIARTICSVKAPPTVEVPIRTFGLKRSMTEPRSFVGSSSLAKSTWRGLTSSLKRGRYWKLNLSKETRISFEEVKICLYKIKVI